MKSIRFCIFLCLLFPTFILPSQCPPGSITFSSQDQIDSFSILYPGCTNFPGNVTIAESAEGDIIDLNGLAQLITIGGFLIIWNNDALVRFSGLSSLRSIGELFWVLNNSSLSDFGLLELLSIGNVVWISKNNSLRNLSGLDSLISVGGYLTIEDNDSLVSLDGMRNLVSANGDLNIRNNPELLHLDGLLNLESINGFLRICDNNSLVNINGLENLDHTTIEELHILDCYMLSQCEILSVCKYLDYGLGIPIILRNAPGCNELQEVHNACDDITSYYVYNVNDDGPGSFRFMLSCSGPNDTIYFDPEMADDTVRLDSGVIIDKDLTIHVSENQTIWINGVNTVNTFEIINNITVEVIGLKILGSNGYAGIVHNGGNLILDDVVIKGDDSAGSIFTSDGTLLLKVGTTISK